MRLSFLLGAVLSACVGTCLAQPTCAPPDAMKAQLQGRPSAAAYTGLGVWFAGREQYACAADAFANSLQLEPNQKDAPHVAFMFGVSLYLSGEKKEAVAALQEAEQLGYQNIQLHIILAGALDASHANKEAEEEWRAALAIDPEATTALDALSNDLLRDGDFAGIIALLESPRLTPQRTPQQSLNLGIAYESTGKLNDAANVLRDGLNTSPDSLAVADRLAKVLVQLNRSDEAATVLELAHAQHAANSSTAH